jgi:hypothetical protein
MTRKPTIDVDAIRERMRAATANGGLENSTPMTAAEKKALRERIQKVMETINE